MLVIHTHTHTHTTVVRPFFQDHPGELVPEENFWTLWYCQRMRLLAFLQAEWIPVLADSMQASIP